jgi:hypothetical protein
MEIDKVKSLKTAQHAIGSKCKSFQSRGHCYDKKSERVGNSASTQFVGSCHDKKSERVGNRASTQFVGSCHDKKSERVGNRASTQLVGSCHDKKSERVGNSASTQLVGFCHDTKSEQVTCSEQEQDAKHPSKIHDSSNTKYLTNKLWQCQTFINNVLIDSWQCQMEIDDVKSHLIKWQCQINIMDLKSEQVGNCASTQLVGSCHDEQSERAGCIASTQQDSTFQLIVGFKADSDFSDIR